MKDKLIELIYEGLHLKEDIVSAGRIEQTAAHLIANGVVVATDNNDGCKGCKGCLYENRKRPQKCSCCSRNIDMKDCYTQDYDRHWTEYPPKGE